MKKLNNRAGRATVTLPPRDYREGVGVAFKQPIDPPVCNAIQPNAPKGYPWLHLKANPRSGT